MKMQELYENKLEDFIASYKSYPTSNWIKVPPFHIYLRLSQRYIDETKVKTLELANFDQPDNTKGKGHFSKLLKRLEELAKQNGFDGVYVENILNPILEQILIAKDYRVVSHDGASSSMFKEV